MDTKDFESFIRQLIHVNSWFWWLLRQISAAINILGVNPATALPLVTAINQQSKSNRRFFIRHFSF